MSPDRSASIVGVGSNTALVQVSLYRPQHFFTYTLVKGGSGSKKSDLHAYFQV